MVNQLGHQRQRRRRQVQLKSPDVFTAAMSPQETVFSSVNEGFDPENSDFFVETHLPTGFRHSPRKWMGFVIGKSGYQPSKSKQHKKGEDIDGYGSKFRVAQLLDG